MKSIAKPSFYFSAYPLKVIKDQTAPEKKSSPYLKAVLKGKSKPSSQKARVFPMANPYRADFKVDPQQTDKLPKDIELTIKEWFNNYE
jgi:hypothetical protein